jgi:hypothetical protein
MYSSIITGRHAPSLSPPLSPGVHFMRHRIRMGACQTTLLSTKDVTTGTVYVLAWRNRQGVTLRDLDSEPGDPNGRDRGQRMGALGGRPSGALAALYLVQPAAPPPSTAPA